MSLANWLMVATIAILTFGTILLAALAVGWTIARLRIWAAEAHFVETQASPTARQETQDV